MRKIIISFIAATLGTFTVAYGQASGVYLAGSSATITNSISSGNKDIANTEINLSGTGVSNNNLTTGSPNFEGADNYRLTSSSSSSLKQGNNSYLPVGLTTDLDGTPFSNPLDLGCYQYVQGQETFLKSAELQAPFAIYPNPVSKGGIVNIVLPVSGNEALSGTASIFSATGGLASITALSGKQSVVIAPEITGIYYLQIVAKTGESFVSKLIVVE